MDVPARGPSWAGVVGAVAEAAELAARAEDMVREQRARWGRVLTQVMATPYGLVGPQVLRRLLQKWALTSDRAGEVAGPGEAVDKPCATSAADMYDPEILLAGEVDLPAGEVRLNADAWDRYHTCAGCRGEGSSTCVKVAVRALITRGWRLPLREGAGRMRPRWDPQSGNHRLCGSYSEIIQRKLDEQVASGVLRPVPAGKLRYVSPALPVVKGSDVSRARSLTGGREDLSTSESIDRFNAAAAAAVPPWERAKLRVAVDLTASGVNAMLKTKPFSMPSVTNLTQKVTKGCWVGALDIRSCYHAYVVALCSRYLLHQVDMASNGLESQCVPFGLGLAPYFASFMVAQVGEMAAALGLDVAFYIDDFAVVGPTEAECNRKLDRLIQLLQELGYEIAAEKVVRATQRIVFLGVEIDTVALTMRIDPTKAGHGLQALDLVAGQLATLGQAAETQTLLRSLLGRLEWYGAVMQGARSRVQALWDLLLGRGHEEAQVQADLAWWRSRLGAWSRGEDVGGVGTTMFSRSALERSALVVATDAGDDGVGGAWIRPPEVQPAGSAAEPEPVGGFREPWPEGPGGGPRSSTGKELQAVRRFVELHPGLVKGRVMVVVTDSMSMTCGLLSGRSRRLPGEMRELMDILDGLRCRVIAVWTPRELNAVPDALASLCVRLGVPSLSGRLADVVCAGSPAGLGAPGRGGQQGGGPGPSLPSGAPGPGAPRGLG